MEDWCGEVITYTVPSAAESLARFGPPGLDRGTPSPGFGSGSFALLAGDRRGGGGRGRGGGDQLYFAGLCHPLILSCPALNNA